MFSGLNKEERYTAYCIIMSYIDKYDDNKIDMCSDGICFLMERLTNCGVSEAMKFLTELKKMKPKNILANGLWFDPYYDGWQKRKRIIADILERLENELYS